MAKPTCTFCGEYEGVLMDTNLDDGDTQIVCGNDLMMYGLSMAVSLTNGMTLEQADEYGELLDALYKNDPREPKPPAPSRGRKRQLAVVPDLPPDGPESDAAATSGQGQDCTHDGTLTASDDPDKLVCVTCGQLVDADDYPAG